MPQDRGTTVQTKPRLAGCTRHVHGVLAGCLSALGHLRNRGPIPVLVFVWNDGPTRAPCVTGGDLRDQCSHCRSQPSMCWNLPEGFRFRPVLGAQWQSWWRAKGYRKDELLEAVQWEPGGNRTARWRHG